MKKIIYLLLTVLMFSSCNNEENVIKDWCEQNNCECVEVTKSIDAYDYPWNDYDFMELSKKACKLYEQSSECYNYDAVELAQRYGREAKAYDNQRQEMGKKYTSTKVVGKLVRAKVGNRFHEPADYIFVIPTGSNQAYCLGEAIAYMKSVFSIMTEFDKQFDEDSEHYFDSTNKI